VERIVPTPDGRTLAVQDRGDPAGRPVLVLRGTPDGRHQFDPWPADAAARGLRLISYDRPGYGGSASMPGRIVADCAEDVRAICAALMIDRMAMWGWSGGGPHVLACAALLPDLVAAVATLASPAPYGADGLDYFAGMGQDNVDSWQLTLTDPVAARAQLDKDREGFLGASASDVVQALAPMLCPADLAAVPEVAEHMLFCTQQALAPGSQGWWDDERAFAAPWGFEPASITVPVLVMHGTPDMFVPVGHGEWLAAHIPTATARILPEDGHVTLWMHRIGEVHSWLAQRL